MLNEDKSFKLKLITIACKSQQRLSSRVSGYTIDADAVQEREKENYDSSHGVPIAEDWLLKKLLSIFHRVLTALFLNSHTHLNLPVMSRNSTNLILQGILFVGLFVLSSSGFSQSESKKEKIVDDAKEAKAEFIKADPKMSGLFSKAYGYVIFPNVGKAAVGIGGASGNGVAYEKGAQIGMAKMTQVSIGFQGGGQAYREVIFFETKEDMDRFKENRVELSAQVSAVAAASGASANAKYVEGVMVFTMQKGGLMYEAAVGGQKFKFEE